MAPSPQVPSSGYRVGGLHDGRLEIDNLAAERALRGPALESVTPSTDSIGVLGGFVSPSVIGLLKTLTGSIQGGLWAMVAILIIGALLLLGSRPSRNPALTN